jgi:hypothetical protein
MIRMNSAFASRWRDLELDTSLNSTTLAPRLSKAIEAPFVRASEALLLEPLVRASPSRDAFPDCTGYEAFINKIHVEDLIDDAADGGDKDLSELIRQGAKAAFVLSSRLSDEGIYRVVLSLDAPNAVMTLRFFQLRKDEPWGSDDPEEYSLEAVLLIDTFVGESVQAT